MKTLLLTAALVGLLALPSSAGPIEDSIVRQLQNQGFSQIEVRRTLLGRSRIVARSNDLYREIVVNPVTGEILRDFWRELGGDGSGTRIVDPSKPVGGQGADGDDDDDDDDRDDDGGGDDGGGDEGGDDGDDD